MGLWRILVAGAATVALVAVTAGAVVAQTIKIGAAVALTGAVSK